VRIVVAGGSGFLGTALVSALRAQGDEVTVLTRGTPHAGEAAWSPGGTAGAWAGLVSAADVVVNLAGAPLVGARWTETTRRVIRESRVTATRALVQTIVSARQPPVFISASGIGVYGLRGDDPVGEEGSAGSDFLARVCQEWEQAAQPAAAVTRVVLLRTGVVLARHGGALPQLARPFWFLVGGPIGSGRQYLSWIHLDDWVAMVRWAMATTAVSGALNVTAPAPVTNASFARALGGALHRPSFVRTPGLPLRLVFGEMAEAAILGGQRVLPRKAQSLAFSYRYPTIEAALGALYHR
jgi:hypothetical protein